MRFLRFFSFLFVIIFLSNLSGSNFVCAKAIPLKYDAGRNRLIAYMLSNQLPAQHFTHKPLDDNLSHSAFKLFLKNLDPRKRFFLKQDVTQLEAFSDHIDDEMRRGLIVLPDAAATLLNERIHDVQILTEKLLGEEIQPYVKDYLELDPEKYDYANNKEEQKELWRKILKTQVINTYFDLLEKELRAKEKDIEQDQLVKKLKSEKEVNKDIWEKAITKVKEKNGHYFLRILKETRQEYYNEYFDSVARAFDPHTNYMAPISKEDFDIHMSGSLEGIGALLKEDEGHIKVVRILPGSAAERQGQLMAEDTILAVSEKDGEPVDMTDMRIRDAVSYIRGPKGTEVRLYVQKPDGKKLVVPIIRDIVQIDETYVKSSLLTGDDKKTIGYISIPSFYRDFDSTRNGGEGRNVTDDFRDKLLSLHPKKLSGLVLDLRNNSGGSLADAVDISGMFLPGGPVVQVKNSLGVIRVLEDEDPEILYEGPMIVLVNKFSASASEILAAALQDYGRALIIGGKHTHGKGTVQALVDMNQNLPLLHLKKYDDLGALKITIQKFYRINGQSTQFKGIEPDIQSPSIIEYIESEEQYLDNPLAWDQVDQLAFDKWHGARFDIGKARLLSKKWISHNDEFNKIKEETTKAIEKSKHTLISVCYQDMLKERLDIDSEEEKQNLFSDNDTQPLENKQNDIKDRLKTDPYVQLSLFLLKDSLISNHTIGRVQ